MTNINNTQTEYICDYCGKSFMVRKSKIDAVKSGLRAGLYCSSQCAKDVQKPSMQTISNAFVERGYRLLSKEYINAKTPLLYECPKHGIKKITYNNLKYGFGCSECGTERRSAKRRNSFDKAADIFAKHNMELLQQPYVNNNTPMKYICKNHPEIGIQLMTLGNASKQHCPYCHISKGENAIVNYLVDNNIQYERQKKFDDLSVGSKGKLSYDFYIPSANLLIEYQGEQHEHPVSVFGGEEGFIKQKERDCKKAKYASTHGYELLEIWYYDYDNIDTILNKKLIA